MEDFEKSTQNDDGRTDTVCEIKETLASFPCHDGLYLVSEIIFGHGL
jgi:hypothetical protein